MNIQSLKTLVANLPDEVTPEQFAPVELEYEEVLAQQRELEIAEMGNLEQRLAKLREKHRERLAAAPPPVRPPPTRVLTGNETDADMGIGSDDEESDRQSFTQELAQLRARGVAKRRSRLEH